ncbi:MAG: DUF21 domain-containing protein [Planctomycetaceae bacterium]|nr:DUF21 domain-containing protein [Planctomycetaceae bacterium]
MTEEILRSLPLWLPGASVMVGLTIASAFFSGSETAVFSLTRDDLQSFRNGRPSERRVVGLLSDPSRLLTAILFWNLVINLSYFAVSVVVARRMIVNGYESVGWLISVLGVVSIILFGEVLPKSISVVFPQQIARTVSTPLAFSLRLLDRFLPIMSVITRGLQRGFWPKLPEETVIDADDLEKAIDLSSQSSEMIAHERNVLHHILDLTEITVEEVMRPRGTYTVVGENCELKDLGPYLPAGGFAAIAPTGSDQVEGIYWLLGTIYHPKKGIESFRENVVYLPWCAHVARALNLMRLKLCHAAVVVDEYGQTMGIVTQRDLFDTIFSTASSRAHRILKRDSILQIGPQTYHVDGMTTLRYLAKELHIESDVGEESSVTVAGLLHDTLRRFPAVSDEVIWQGWKFRVIDVIGLKRVRVLLEPAEPNGSAEGEGNR